MAVNTTVYGTPEQWIDCSFNRYITNKNKVAYFAANASRLENGVSAGKISYSEPIDKSLSYCGLGEESALSHIGYIYKSGNTYDIREWQDSFVTNFAFFQQNSVDIDMSQNVNEYRFDDNNIYTGTVWQTTQTYSNKNKYLQPYTLINPKNLVLCIYIRCCNTAKTDYRDIDLKTYMTTYKTSHPYIICAYINAFFNNQAWTEANPRRTISGDTETSINGNLRTLSYGRLDSYKCEGKNFEAYNYFLCDCTVFGFFSRSEGFIYQDKLFFVMATETAKEHVRTYLTGGDQDLFAAYIEYFDGVYDEIMKTVACFGLYFTDSATTAATGKLTDNNMCIGLLDDNGIGHGEYLHGADTVNAPQAAADFTDMHVIPYDPNKTDYDKTKYKNDTQFYDSALANGFTRFWVLGSSQVDSLLSELYSIINEVDPDEPIERYSQQVFLTNNPIDCVVSLKKFPLQNIPSIIGPGLYIQLGSKTTNIQAQPLAKSCGVYYFTFSSSSDTGLYPHYNNSFLDYEPYTTVKITVPFCGTVQIPTTYFYDYGGVTVALVIDFISGACTGYIMAKGITIDSVSGNCAISLPLSGIQSATLDSQIHSVAMAREKQQTTLGTGLIAGAVSIGFGLATGNLPAAIGGAAAVVGSFMHAEDTGQQINYELSHMQTPLKQVAAASGQIAHTYDMRCKMVITRPKLEPGFDDAAREEYAKTIGFACLENGTVQQFHGLTLANIDLSGINCTAEEKNMIRAAFANGVYLPAEYSDTYWT